MEKKENGIEEIMQLIRYDGFRLSVYERAENEEELSFFFDDNENFLQSLRDLFRGNGDFRSLLIAFGREAVYKKLPFNPEFGEYDIPAILAALLQSSSNTDIYVSLYIIAGLAKNSKEYVFSLVNECVHKQIMKILTNKESVSRKLVNQLLALKALKFIALESEVSRDKLLACASLGKIASTLLLNFKTDDTIKCLYGYIKALLSYKSIKREYFISVMNVLTAIKDLVGRKHIVGFLKCVSCLSEYGISGFLIEQNTVLYDFIELSYTDMDQEIIRETTKVVSNMVKHGCKLRPSIVHIALRCISCTEETIFQPACELCIQVLMHCLQVEYIDLDIGVLIKRAMEGSRKTKECALDLLVYYLMCRNDKIIEAIDNSLMSVILQFIDGDDKDSQIKVIELAKILMKYQELTGYNAVDEFADIGGVDRLIEILDETYDDEIKESIEELLQTYYDPGD
jgi:hypothetical protein